MYLNHYNKSSSFPSILMQYDTQRLAKQVHWSRRTKEEERSKGIKQRRDDLVRLENTVEKKGRTEMRALKLEAIAREQLARYDSYIQRLNDKVARQRAEMRRRTEETETRILAQEQQRRRERKARKTQPLPPINNPDHFKKYPKTKFGQTVLLGDDLKRKGFLRCQEEVDRFWHTNMFGHNMKDNIFTDGAVNVLHRAASHRSTDTVAEVRWYGESYPVQVGLGGEGGGSSGVSDSNSVL